MSPKAFSAREWRSDKRATEIKAVVPLIDGGEMEFRLRVLRGQEALEVKREALELSKGMTETMGGAENLNSDVSDVDVETLEKLVKVQDDNYLSLLKRTVILPEGETAGDADWESIAIGTGGRDSKLGRAVFRAAGLVHPSSAVLGDPDQWDDLPFLSRGKRGKRLRR